MQAEPMKSMLKAPGTKRLKQLYYETPSTFAFKFNLRRYNQVTRCRGSTRTNIRRNTSRRGHRGRDYTYPIS
jgi:hypothetical protein